MGFPAACLTVLTALAAPAAAVAQPPPCSPQTNDTDVPIHDMTTVTSTIYFSSCSTVGSRYSRVTVDIAHTYRGDLEINLLAQDGSAYRLRNASWSDKEDDLVTSFSVDLTSEMGNGKWTLRVRDRFAGDFGTLRSWGLSLVG